MLYLFNHHSSLVESKPLGSGVMSTLLAILSLPSNILGSGHKIRVVESINALFPESFRVTCCSSSLLKLTPLSRVPWLRASAPWFIPSTWQWELHLTFGFDLASLPACNSWCSLFPPSRKESLCVTWCRCLWIVHLNSAHCHPILSQGRRRTQSNSACALCHRGICGLWSGTVQKEAYS